MAGSSNSFYGHRAILAQYAGLKRERPILGYLQHGWHHGWAPWLDDELHYAGLPGWIPKLMWSADDARAVTAAGATPVAAVGAPFLYLLEMRGFTAPPGDGSMVCFPYHASEIGLHDTNWQSYTDYISEIAGSRRVTMCLHPIEYANPSIGEFLRDQGFEVTTNGTRDDPRFLYRLADLVEAHDEVAGNRLGTALVYGGAMGRRVSLGGPTPGMTEDSHGRPLVEEARLIEDFQRERYPNLLAGLDHDEAMRFSRAELGAGDMLGPDALAHALGWRGVRRVQGRGLALLAGVRRRISPTRPVISPTPPTGGAAGD